MVLSSSQLLQVPETDLLSWLFADNSHSDNPVCIDAADDSKKIDYGQALALIRRLIAGFYAVGLEPGDAVCLHAFNHIIYSSLYLAVIGAGGCVVGSNPAYETLELQHLLLTTKAKYVIVEASLLDKALPALLAVGMPASRLYLFFPDDNEDATFGLTSWKFLLQHGERSWIKFNNEARARATKAALFLTSGTTTGFPKPAVISHYALVAAGVAVNHLETRKPDDISYLISLPQFHAFAAPLVLLAAFRPGRTMYIMRRFEVHRFLSYVHRYGISDIVAVPHILASLNARASSKQLASLKRIMCAGSPLPRMLEEQTCSLLHPDAVLSQNWGMTEIGWISTFAWPERDIDGSVGRLLPNIQAKVVDEHSNEVCEGANGELYVSGPSLMNGYLNNPTATATALNAGWLRTGDLGCLRNGKIYIVGRIKDIIKVRGWQVSPSELESTLLLHPAISDVAVIGVPNADEKGGGEVPRAYYKVLSHCDLTADEVVRFVGSRLASYKALDGGAVLVDSIPRNSSGKIDRKRLLERWRAETTLPATTTIMNGQSEALPALH